MKKNLTILIIITASFCSRAQIAPSWVRYSTPSNYQNYDVKEVSTGVDSSSNVYTAASMYDTINNLNKIMLVKYSPSGTQIWKQFYDNNDPNYNGSYLVSLLVDKAGNCYLCGYGISDNVNGKDFLIVNYDNTGNMIWSSYLDGGQNQNDYATSATFDHSGNIIVAGYANDFGTNGDDIAVMKFSPSGTFFWSYIYNNATSNDEDRAYAVASDTSNNIFITGSTYVTNDRDMITMKLDSNGANQWTKHIAHVQNGSDEFGLGITTDNSGNCYVSGTPGDLTTYKYDANGNSIWTNHYTNYVINGSRDPIKVMLDKYNNVIVASDAFVSTANQSDLIVNKINNLTGNSVWSINYNNAGIDNFTDAALDTNANIYVTGYFEGPLSTDMSVMIVSPTGNVIWHTTFSNPVNTSGGDRPYQMVIDKSRNIILAGVSETRGSSSVSSVDVVTLKFPTSITGINTIANETATMNIYPNPAKDNLTITISDASLLGCTVKIINMMGETVSEAKIISLTQQFNLSNLTNGIYFVNFNNGKKSFSKKLIIE